MSLLLIQSGFQGEDFAKFCGLLRIYELYLMLHLLQLSTYHQIKKYVLIGHKSENFEHFLQLALQNMGTMKVVCGNVITMFVQYDSLLLIFSFW